MEKTKSLEIDSRSEKTEKEKVGYSVNTFGKTVLEELVSSLEKG